MQQISASVIWDDLKPRIDALIATRISASGVRSAGATGGAVSAHALSGALHTGLLDDGQAPQFLLRSGGRSLTGDLAVDSGIMVDGVDISAHAANANAHHAQAHALVGADHTAAGLAVGNVVQATGATSFTWAALDHQYIINSLPDQHHAQVHGLISANHTATGLTAGHVVRASAADAFAFARLNHTDLEPTSVTANQHHNQQHVITGGDHTVTGAQWNVVGLTGTDALGLILPSYNVGAVQALLMTDSAGALSLQTLAGAVKLRSPLIDTVSGALTLRPATDLVLDPDSNLTKFVDFSSIQTNAFTSGFAGAGLRIDQGVSRASKTTIETDDIYVRGRMHVYEMLIHQIRATNGSVFVSSTGKATVVTSEGGSNYRIDVDPETMHGFSAGDVIRAQRFTGTGVYQCDMVVNSPVVSTSYFSAGLVAGTPAAGMEFVRLGNTGDTSRQGALYLTADDSGAPFIDVVDGILSHADWNTAGKVKVRLGKLTGITGTANEYGLLARNGTANDSGYLKASTAGFELRNADFRIYSSAGANQGSWTYSGIEFPLLTSAFKTITWAQAGEAETTSAIRGSALTNQMRLEMLGSLGPSRSDGYVALDMTGYDAGPTLGEKSYVRAGVLRVSGTARSYTALMATQKNFLLGPAVCVSADVTAITDPTVTRAGLYFTNVYTAYGGASSAEIANDTGTYKALMLLGNTAAGSTKRVQIYENVSINGAAFNESALNVAGTAEISAGTSRPLKLTTSSAGPYALELYRSDQTASVNMMNYDGNTLYVDAAAILAETGATNGVVKDMLYMRAGADGTLGSLDFAIRLKPSATGSSRKAYMGAGDASAMRALIMNSNGAGAYGPVGIGMDSPTKMLHVAGTLIVDGDEGGVSGTVGFTDTITGISSGVGTVKMGGTTARDSEQWLKVYFGTTAYYIPCWSNIS